MEQLDRRWQSGQQLIQTNGITYNVYGDPQGKERPWLMDPIPLVMEPRNGRHLERAITQRATLLNAVLADLYGERTSDPRDSACPPRCCLPIHISCGPASGFSRPGGVHLHTYAVDLARSPDGNWWVIADRTQAPSGIGYALENRLVSARTLPAAFNQCHVRQLNAFLRYRSGTRCWRLRPTAATNPRVVLLTPGPAQRNLFRTFLPGAALGLSSGGRRRSHGAWTTACILKTLAGLEPVDLILRRLDDSFCDPLELRGDSLLGVPGSDGRSALRERGRRQCAGERTGGDGRAHGVSSEPLPAPAGRGIADAFGGHLVVRAGEAARYVLEHLEELVIKACVSAARQDPWNFRRRWTRQPGRISPRASKPTRSSSSRRSRWLFRRLPFAPKLASPPRHVVLRVFAAWDGTSYTVMPGGLTRVSTEDSSLVVSMQLGGGSKDTWVLRPGQGPDASTPAASRNAAPGQRRTPQPRRRQSLLAGPLRGARGIGGASCSRSAAGALWRRRFRPHRFAGNHRRHPDGSALPSSGVCHRVDRPAALARAAIAEPHGLRSVAHLRYRLESETNAPRQLAVEGAAVAGYLARAAAAGNGILLGAPSASRSARSWRK